MPDWNASATNAAIPEFEHVSEGPQLAPPATSKPQSFRSNSTVRPETWMPVARWGRENGAGPLRQIASGAVQVFTLQASDGVLTFQPKTLVAKWNGQEFRLGFPPQLIGGQPYMHVLDLEKNIRPLLRGLDLPAKSNRVIVIDPGHGGQNSGTHSVLDNTAEKEFTMDWALRIARLLATNGWEVVLTRTNDQDVSLSNRVAIAEHCNADLFLSLHFNSAAPSEEQYGIETYCLTPTGMASTLTRGYEDNAALAFPNNAFDETNFLLAMDVQRSLLNATATLDRGVRRARFLGVLRGQHRPSALIEGGYLSNPREARLIADADYRQKLAEAVADALNVHEERNSSSVVSSLGVGIRPAGSSTNHLQQ